MRIASARDFFAIPIFFLTLTLFTPASPARVLYVSPSGIPDGTGASWETAFNTIAAGLTAAASGDEVWVRSTTYSGLVTMKEGVSVYGGFLGTEKTSEERDWLENETVILGGSPAVRGADYAILDGLTITGGNSQGYAPDGGGIYCHSNSPTFRNCRIIGNSADNNGGGIWLYNSSASLINCTISENSALNYGSGVFCIGSSTPTLTDCFISGNGPGYYGGGICCCDGSSPILTNCTITDNSSYQYGGGVCSFGNSLLVNCTITENSSAHGGGICCAYSNSILTSCSIANNSAGESGGGVYCFDSSSSLQDCAISKNEAEYYGGGLSFEASSSSMLSRCTIAGNIAKAVGGGGLFVYESSPSLRDCAIIGNMGAGYEVLGGGVCCYLASPTLINCTIVGNSFSGSGGFDTYGGGVYSSYSSPALINCTLIENFTRRGSGIYISDKEVPIIVTDYFKQGLEITTSQSSLPIVTNCVLWNRGTEIDGIGLDEAKISFSNVQGGWPGEGNMAANPGLTQWWDGNSVDIHLHSGSPCIDAGTEVPGVFTDFEADPRPSGGGWDIGADECVGDCVPGDPSPGPRIWYVSSGVEGGDGSSWEFPLGRISDALDRATLSDEIWVRSGTYREAIGMELGVGLYGGFSGKETEREQRDWNAHKTVIDASGLESSVVTCNSISSATLDGFVLTGGVSSNGGGVYCYDSAAAFANCMIKDNTADYYGGGLHCEQASPFLWNCAILRNSARYGGGGIGSEDSSPVFRNCTIANNRTFSTGQYSGGPGGGLYSWWSKPSFINCTVANNTADQDGDGLYCFSRDFITLKNCILRNAGDEIVGYYTPSTSVTYSCIDGGWPGEGNIDADPMFLRLWDGTGADLRLRPGSPCIDAGTSVPSLTTDLAGNPRPVDIPGVGWEGEGAIDMGAYERQVPDVGDIRGTAFFNYSLFWQRSEGASSPAIDETEFNIYNTWLDDRIDWRDIFTALEIVR